MKIYLVRHGQTDNNLNKLYNCQNEDINQTGIEQAKVLREKIKDLEVDVIYSSTLLRAKHTAEILNINNKEIIFDDRLVERNPGSLEGQPYEITDREEVWNYYSKNIYGTQETIPDLFKRVTEFLDELKEKKYDNILIVAHSGVSKAFYAYFNGIPKDGKFLNLGLKNTELKEYNL